MSKSVCMCVRNARWIGNVCVSVCTMSIHFAKYDVTDDPIAGGRERERREWMYVQRYNCIAIVSMNQSYLEGARCLPLLFLMLLLYTNHTYVRNGYAIWAAFACARRSVGLYWGRISERKCVCARFRVVANDSSGGDCVNALSACGSAGPKCSEGALGV